MSWAQRLIRIILATVSKYLSHRIFYHLLRVKLNHFSRELSPGRHYLLYACWFSCRCSSFFLHRRQTVQKDSNSNCLSHLDHWLNVGNFRLLMKPPLTYWKSANCLKRSCFALCRSCRRWSLCRHCIVNCPSLSSRDCPKRNPWACCVSPAMGNHMVRKFSFQYHLTCN